MLPLPKRPVSSWIMLQHLDWDLRGEVLLFARCHDILPAGRSSLQKAPPEPRAEDVRNELMNLSDGDDALHTQRFFKTGPGEYGEGDRFLGIRVPKQREIAKKYRHISRKELTRLLRSRFHEERLTALIILVHQFEKADNEVRQEIYELYMNHRAFINNWDLIDISAPRIVGPALLDRSRSVLYEWAASGWLWDRRIAILATFAFIRKGEYHDTFQLAEQLLDDDHDLMHKAVGWMLREVGKRDPEQLEDFLKPRYGSMPRTMLRYSIEKMPEEKRQGYLKGFIK